MATAAQTTVTETVEQEVTRYELTLTSEEARYLDTLLRGAFGSVAWGIYNALTTAAGIDVFSEPVAHSGWFLVDEDGNPYR